jgi:hypothetical protein
LMIRMMPGVLALMQVWQAAEQGEQKPMLLGCADRSCTIGSRWTKQAVVLRAVAVGGADRAGGEQDVIMRACARDVGAQHAHSRALP